MKKSHETLAPFKRHHETAPLTLSDETSIQDGSFTSLLFFFEERILKTVPIMSILT